MTSAVTLITGASAGLGAEFARQCARRGEALVLTARREDRLRALAEEVGGAEVITADLSREGAAEKLIGEVEARGLRVATLINNAGFGKIGRFADLGRPIQREMIDLNCGALAELAHLVIPHMRALGGGGILNVASTAAFQAGPGFAAYFATKAFVLSFSEALHEELRREKIKVSCLCPGPTRTEFGQVAGTSPEGGFDFSSADPVAVVAAGLAGLDANKAIVIPGFGNNLTAQSNRLLPRAAMRRIVAAIKL